MKTIDELKESSFKLTDNVLSELQYALNRDYTIEQACRRARIHKDTYYEWIKASDEFAEVMERAKDDIKVKSKEVVYDSIAIEKDKEMALKILERREKEIYSTRTEQSIDGGLQITKEIINKVNEDTNQEPDIPGESTIPQP